MKRCYLSHPNSVSPAVLDAATDYLKAEGWEVVDPTSLGKAMMTERPWEWEYQGVYLLTTNPDHVIGRGQFQDVVNFTGRGIPVVHLGTGHTVVAVRKGEEARSWKVYGALVLAGPGQEVCDACMGSGCATGFAQGPCGFCGGTGVKESEPE